MILNWVLKKDRINKCLEHLPLKVNVHPNGFARFNAFFFWNASFVKFSVLIGESVRFFHACPKRDSTHKEDGDIQLRETIFLEYRACSATWANMGLYVRTHGSQVLKYIWFIPAWVSLNQSIFPPLWTVSHRKYSDQQRIIIVIRMLFNK